jgi:hypothetical protein
VRSILTIRRFAFPFLFRFRCEKGHRVYECCQTKVCSERAQALNTDPLWPRASYAYSSNIGPQVRGANQTMVEVYLGFSVAEARDLQHEPGLRMSTTGSELCRRDPRMKTTAGDGSCPSVSEPTQRGHPCFWKSTGLGTRTRTPAGTVKMSSQHVAHPAQTDTSLHTDHGARGLDNETIGNRSQSLRRTFVAGCRNWMNACVLRVRERAIFSGHENDCGGHLAPFLCGRT